MYYREMGNRTVIRDDYGYIYYEIFLEDGILTGFDYTLGRCLKKEGVADIVLRIYQMQNATNIQND